MTTPTDRNSRLTTDCRRLAAVALALLTFVSVAAQAQTEGAGVTYKTLRVKAPFRMPKLRECVFPDRTFTITDYGAVPDDIAANTAALAAAVSACHEAGGGRVVVPAGVWQTGPVHLKSNVLLWLSENAELAFTDRPEAYLPAVMTTWEGLECFNYSPLVYAFECENVGIAGPGTLRPKMDKWREWFGRPDAHIAALGRLYTMASTDVPVSERQMAEGENNMRPQLVQMNRCRNVLLQDFKIRESPFWTLHLYMCDNCVVRGLDVQAHGHNNDGIDIEMTRNVLVEQCTFDQGDDAVVIKSGRNRDAWRLNSPTENVVVRHCDIHEGHTLLGIGSELSGGIRNVYLHDCTVPEHVRRLFFVKTNARRGGFAENIYMENVHVENVERVLEIATDVLYQWKDLPTYEERVTRIEGLYLRHVSCDTAEAVYELNGDPRLPPRHIVLEDVKVQRVKKFGTRVAHCEDVRTEGLTYKLAEQ